MVKKECVIRDAMKVKGVNRSQQTKRNASLCRKNTREMNFSAPKITKY